MMKTPRAGRQCKCTGPRKGPLDLVSDGQRPKLVDLGNDKVI